MRKGVLLLVVVLGVVVMLSGCLGPSTPSAPVNPGDIGISLPSSDVSGQDITTIPRIDGSIRYQYSKSEGEIEVGYYVKEANFNDVVNYYKSNMQKEGWVLASENTEAGGVVSTPYGEFGSKQRTTLEYSRTQGDTQEYATINIEETVYKDEKYILIDISYTSYNNNNNTPSEESYFEQQHNVVIADSELKERNAYFMNILNEVFGDGNVKVIEANRAAGYMNYLRYITRNKITDDEIQELVSTIEQEGMQLIGSENNGDEVTYSFKENDNTVLITTIKREGEVEISETVTP